MGQEVESPTTLGVKLRFQLETAARELGLATGHTQLLLDYVDGSLRWYEPRHVRVPASRLEQVTDLGTNHADGS